MPVARQRRDSRRVNKRGETWDQTAARVHAQYPSTTANQDWWYDQLESKRLREWILHDVLNIGMIEDSGGQDRRGSRPPLDYRVAMEELRKLRGEDFTTLPFHESFRVLAGTRSMRHLAEKVGMSRMQCYRLYTGAIVPTGHEMEQVAVAFRKNPSFFREYRTAVVCSLTARLLDDNPERSAVIIQKLTALR